MYNWKDTRNYRRFRDENGNVIANIIYVDGEEVAVSDEVYEAYASMDRRERYLTNESDTWKNGITTTNRCPWMRFWRKATPKLHSAAQRIWRT